MADGFEFAYDVKHKKRVDLGWAVDCEKCGVPTSNFVEIEIGKMNSKYGSTYDLCNECADDMGEVLEFHHRNVRNASDPDNWDQDRWE